MLVRAQDGSYVWGKYYQNHRLAKNSTTYLGLVYACKFSRDDQKIVVSGQVNFFRSFIGTLNVTDGSFIDTVLF